MAKVSIDLKRLNKAAQEAFRDACMIAHAEMINVISEPGAFDGFDGDIVDTGALWASQQVPEINGSTARFVNSIDYAIFVYAGVTLRNGREIPGRPWMKLALDRMANGAGIQGAFNTLLEAKLK